ncbi:hypothetical protein ACQKWADRAFT_290554 [Trichoderma austrokoningii]
MINLSSKPRSTENGMTCPMCRERLGSVQKYQRHVGRHQEQLAIFALPSIQSQDDEDDLDDDESNPIKSEAGSEGIDAVDDKAHFEEADTYNYSLPPLTAEALREASMYEETPGSHSIDDAINISFARTNEDIDQVFREFLAAEAATASDIESTGSAATLGSQTSMPTRVDQESETDEWITFEHAPYDPSLAHEEY